MIRTGDLLDNLRFKGGTCLRKCYFPEYRFSEDLDFTASKYISPDDIQKRIQKIGNWITDHDGPDFQIQPIYFEIVEDEYGSESYQARIYYRGPLRWSGSPRTVRLDITRHEKLCLPSKENQITHPYSDQINFMKCKLPCYSLEEVVAEKIRAVGGQRRFAVSRDLYDIYNLVSHGINMKLVKEILPDKFAARGLRLDNIAVPGIEKRRLEFKLDWERRLNYLVQNKTIAFDSAWQCVLQVLKEVGENFEGTA